MGSRAPWRVRRWSFGPVLIAASGAACNTVLGINEPHPQLEDAEASISGGAGGADAGSPATGSGGAGAAGAGTNPDPGDSGTAGVLVDAAGPDAAEAAYSGVSHAWAEWPMPNPAAGRGYNDAALPNPQSYDTTTTQGVVIDNVTHLQWQAAIDAYTYGWSEAVAHCSSLTLAGGGWRLPTRIELLSLFDFSRFSPSINLEAFSSMPIDAWLWSASPAAGSSTQAWSVNLAFYDGIAVQEATTTGHRVLCVR